MGGLSEQDRAELAAAKRRSPNAHWIEVAVETIVARNVAAALTEAADALDIERDRWVRGAYKEGIKDAARIVRVRIPPP